MGGTFTLVPLQVWDEAASSQPTTKSSSSIINVFMYNRRGGSEKSKAPAAAISLTLTVRAVGGLNAFYGLFPCFDYTHVQ